MASKSGIDVAKKMITPGPDNYDIKSEFDKIVEKPKFSFQTKPKGGKLNDVPGPGEYETDMRPNAMGNQMHVFGTGKRSDLGVGKAYLQPGPGQYDIRTKHDGPKVGFGSERKKTKVKKTYDPGPGSYDLPGTVGNIPKHLQNA